MRLNIGLMLLMSIIQFVLVLLSFIVFLPEWKSISKLDDSMYKRRSMVVLGMAHEYRHGYQHMLQK